MPNLMIAASWPMRKLAILCICSLLVMILARPVGAVTLLRDADMDHALAQLAAPVLRAAGLSPKSVQIVVIRNQSLNAFIIDRRHIFLHSGLIEKMRSADMLQAAIAHEAAHIANGHAVQRSLAAQNARGISALAMIVGAAGLALGEGGPGVALAYGLNASGLRNFLAHSRSDESAADQSAMRYLRRAGVAGQGMVEVFELFAGQETLSQSRQDPYMRSHPLSRDRLRAMRSVAAGVLADPTKQASAGYWFARAQGKLSAYLRAPKWTELRVDKGDDAKDVKAMRRAVAAMRQSQTNKALGFIDRALNLRPGDPYYLDLKAEILLRAKRLKEAVGIYKLALSKAPNNTQITAGYGRALLAAGRPKAALEVLDPARARDPGNSQILRDMGLGYAQTGQKAMAALLAAERYLLQGKPADAKRQAQIAQRGLKQGGKAWRRAQDILDLVG